MSNEVHGTAITTTLNDTLTTGETDATTLIPMTMTDVSTSPTSMTTTMILPIVETTSGFTELTTLIDSVETTSGFGLTTDATSFNVDEVSTTNVPPLLDVDDVANNEVEFLGSPSNGVMSRYPRK